MQQRMHNEIEAYAGTKVRTSIKPPEKLRFLLLRNMWKKLKKKATKSKRGALSEALGQSCEIWSYEQSSPSFGRYHVCADRAR